MGSCSQHSLQPRAPGSEGETCVGRRILVSEHPRQIPSSASASSRATNPGAGSRERRNAAPPGSSTWAPSSDGQRQLPQFLLGLPNDVPHQLSCGSRVSSPLCCQRRLPFLPPRRDGRFIALPGAADRLLPAGTTPTPAGVGLPARWPVRLLLTCSCHGFIQTGGFSYLRTRQ
jgi:hypothetical protein